MAHPRDLVSRIKGALKAGLKPKQLAAWTDIPASTIREWREEQNHATVPADDSVAQDIREALLGKFMGRKSPL
jgi:hypothetical protein